MSATGSRALMVLAVGFLALDAVLLLLAGFWLSRWLLVGWGVVFGAGAFGVVALWRRYLRHMVDLDHARAALKSEAERLRAALGRTGSAAAPPRRR